MLINEFNGLNIIIDKKLELMLAIHAVYKKNNLEANEELEFIETPPVEYFGQLEQLINSVEHQDLIDSILGFKDESTCVQIALGLNNNYEIDKNRIRYDNIEKYLEKVNLDNFVEKFKDFAKKTNWDNFFDEHRNFYQKLFLTFCDFPENLNLNDIENFYGKKGTSYNYIPSILMNGGFAHEDKLGNLYYIRGIQWNNEKNKFYYDKEYLLECLFHEFSHPHVNALVDKNIVLFTNLAELHREAIDHNLPKTYSSNSNILLYEYFVRANANILTRKYYSDAKIDDWILVHGFQYLNIIIEYTIQNMSKYKDYEEFFTREMIPFMNDILKNDKKS